MKMTASLAIAWIVGMLAFFGFQSLLFGSARNLHLDLLTARAILPLFVLAAIVFPLGDVAVDAKEECTTNPYLSSHRTGACDDTDISSGRS